MNYYYNTEQIIMLSSVSACPKASIVLSLVILTIILDSYLVLTYNYYRSNTVILALTSSIIVIFCIFLVWLANKTCNDYTIVTWIILIYLFFGIIDTISSIINPEKRAKELKEIDEIMSSGNHSNQNKQGTK